jgi:hypothetical protein
LKFQYYLNYNSNEVLLKCIAELKSYFDIDRWQINQPIIKSDVLNRLGNVKGVQNVVGVSFKNLYDSTLQNYSGNIYDLILLQKMVLFIRR